MSIADCKPVVIVGGGLAGLSCALSLQEQGHPFLLLDASDRVGGKLRTDLVDGFLLDRGFQVVLSGYPQIQRLWPADSSKTLAAGRFMAGAVCWDGHSFRLVADALRHPETFIETLTGQLVNPADALRLVKLRQQALENPDADAGLSQLPDQSTKEFLAEQGFSPSLLQVLFHPFYRGVLLDRQLKTSARKVLWTFRYFATGYALLPNQGVQQLAQELAQRLPPANIRLNTRISTVDGHNHRVITEAGEVIDASQMVLATDYRTTAQLLGPPPHQVPAPDPSTGTVALYFGLDQLPGRLHHPKMLHLNGSGQGLINHWCFPSAVVPGCAPPDKHLLSVSLIGTYPDMEDETLWAQVREELVQTYGSSALSWNPLRLYRVDHALPPATSLYGQAPWLAPLQHLASEKQVVLAGDYLTTGSIDGALSSGWQATQKIMTFS